MQECDIEKGCLLPDSQTETVQLTHQNVDIIFITDPICSHCWAIEPMWRRLQLNYHITYRYIHGGLLPSWESFRDAGHGITKPSDVAEHWQHVADYFKQPIDPSVWLKDPLSNSIILCKATLAVRQLAPQLESHFLRRMREHIFLFAKNLSRENLLLDCIQEFNIDTNKFTQLLHSNSLHQLFINEQQEMHQLGAMGFPSLVMPSKQPPSLLVGSQSYAQIEKALLTSKEDIKHKKLNSNEQLLSFPSWTLREACEVLQCNESTADTQLKQANFKSIAVAGSKFYQIENM